MGKLECALVWDRQRRQFEIIDLGDIHARWHITLAGGSFQFCENLYHTAFVCDRCGEPRLGTDLECAEPVTLCRECYRECTRETEPQHGYDCANGADYL